jgi:hypothetical protein
MKRPKPKDKTSKADLMRKLLRQNIDLTRQEASVLGGHKDLFSHGQFSEIKKEIRAELAGKEPLEKKENRREDRSKDAITMKSLLDENAYLQWQLEGERKGYMDRWLIERTDNDTL